VRVEGCGAQPVLESLARLEDPRGARRRQQPLTGGLAGLAVDLERQLLGGQAAVGEQQDGEDLGTLPITGLTPGTTYRYRIVATNADGTATGAVGSFTTGPGV